MYLFCWQLGLADKNILSYDFDLVASDHSDPNTNSTTLFSDDTDDKSHRCPNQDTGISTHQEHEVRVTFSNLLHIDLGLLNNKLDLRVM